MLRRGGEYLLGLVTLLAVVSLAVGAEAPSAAYGPFEPGDLETIAGRVVVVRTLPRAGGGVRDVSLVLRTSIGDEVPVAVAPRWVVDALGLRLHRGDEIEVAGWRIVRGKPALVTAEVRTGPRVFVFRDRYGTAAWTARRRLRPLPPAY